MSRDEFYDSDKENADVPSIDINLMLSHNIHNLKQRIISLKRDDIDISRLLNPGLSLANTTPNKLDYYIEKELFNIITTKCGSTTSTQLPIHNISNEIDLQSFNAEEGLIKIHEINLNSWLMVYLINIICNKYRYVYLIRSKLTDVLSDTVYIYVRDKLDKQISSRIHLIGIADYIDFLYSIYSFTIYLMNLAEKLYYDDKGSVFDPDFPHIKIKTMDEYLNYVKFINKEITMI